MSDSFTSHRPEPQGISDRNLNHLYVVLIINELQVLTRIQADANVADYLVVLFYITNVDLKCMSVVLLQFLSEHVF